LAPAVARAVGEVLEDPNRLLRLGELRRGLGQLRRQGAQQAGVLRQAEDVVDAVRLAPGPQELAAEAAAAAQHDRNPRPGLPQARDDADQVLERPGAGVEV